VRPARLSDASLSGDLCRWLGRTPVQTFLLCPICIFLFESAWQGGLPAIAPWGTALLLWGYVQYRLVGGWRLPQAGGSAGMDVLPERLIDTGPYRFTRNPMYLGHIIYLIGLALTFRSWFGLAVAMGRTFWFHQRVQKDEERLTLRFGAEYIAYMARVKRWIPWLL